MWTTVTTQQEFDAALAARKSHIELTAQITVDLRVPDGFVPAIKAITGSLVRLFAGSVVARGSSSVLVRVRPAWRCDW
jgi:hypothetical protein